MLRYGFLPSDFHPQVLILGERSDLEQLGLMLIRFATNCKSFLISNDPAIPDAVSIEVTISQEEADVVVSGRHLQWRITRESAESFGEEILELARGDFPAGSVMLDSTSLHGIPVKVSQGEFTDSFLTTTN